MFSLPMVNIKMVSPTEILCIVVKRSSGKRGNLLSVKFRRTFWRKHLIRTKSQASQKPVKIFVSFLQLLVTKYGFSTLWTPPEPTMSFVRLLTSPESCLGDVNRAVFVELVYR